MNNRLKKGAAVLCAMTMAAGMMAGCGNSNHATMENVDKTLFSYDGKDVTLQEAYIYAQMSAANYEQYYSAYFGSDFWGMDMGNGNFQDYVKEQVISQMKTVIVLDKKAEEAGMSLTEDEVADCKKYAEAFAKDAKGKAILEECGASQDVMQQIYEDNKLASKMEAKMVKDIDTNVSDEEARQTTISRIVFETTKTDDEGNVTEMTEAEKADVKKKAEESLKKIKAGTSIEEEAANQEYTNTSETFGAGESEEGETFEAKLAKKKDGDLLQKVQECNNGYVIAQLVSYTDEAATANKKEEILSQRESEKFSETYEEWTKDLEEKWDYKKDVDQTLWAQVKFSDVSSTSTEAAEETTGAAESDTSAAETTTQAK